MVNEGSGQINVSKKTILQDMAVHQISLAFWTKLSFLLIFKKPEAALETLNNKRILTKAIPSWVLERFTSYKVDQKTFVHWR